jgi:ATP-binding cassette subfamily B protein
MKVQIKRAPKAPSAIAAAPGLIRTFRRFGPYVRQQRPALVLGTIGMLSQVALRVIEPWPLKIIIDVVTTPVGSVTRRIPLVGSHVDHSNLLLFSSIAILILAFLRSLAAYSSAIGFGLAGNRVLTQVRGDLYRHLNRLPLSFHAKARTGELLSHVMTDVGRLQDVAVSAAIPLMINTGLLVTMLLVMTLINWKMTLLAFSTAPLLYLMTFTVNKKIKVQNRHRRQVQGQLAASVAEGFGAMEVVQAYSLENVFEQAFSKNNKSTLTDGLKAKRLEAGLQRKVDILIAVSTGLVMFFGSKLVIQRSMTPGDLILFLLYLKTAFKPMRDTAKFSTRIAGAAASGERILELLDIVPDIEEHERAVNAPRFAGSVSFEGVTLAYAKGRRAVDGLDLHVDPGTTVALVGPSGAGKSSIGSLVPRLYDPDVGRVLIDGTDIRAYTLESLRKQIAMVLQDGVLFGVTIRENIAYGAPKATDQEIVEAARLANAHKFISALPNGYDTKIGERGVMLSGGERQRIAIARAAVRKAPIVILDEPTKGLDEANARDVVKALRRLSEGRTIIHIAHDLHTIRDADAILFVEMGKIVESGTHDQLMALRGRYAAMYISQRRSMAGGPVSGEEGLHALAG